VDNDGDINAIGTTRMIVMYELEIASKYGGVYNTRTTGSV